MKICPLAIHSPSTGLLVKLTRPGIRSNARPHRSELLFRKLWFLSGHRQGYYLNGIVNASLFLLNASLFHLYIALPLGLGHIRETRVVVQKCSGHVSRVLVKEHSEFHVSGPGLDANNSVWMDTHRAR